MVGQGGQGWRKYPLQMRWDDEIGCCEKEQEEIEGIIGYRYMYLYDLTGDRTLSFLRSILGEIIRMVARYCTGPFGMT